jgi:hypothetical protein
MHLYLKYQSPTTFGSKDIAQVKSFSKVGQSSRYRSLGQKFWYKMKGLFMKYLYVKYHNPIPPWFKRLAQVKVFSLRCDADTGVKTIALWTFVLAS